MLLESPLCFCGAKQLDEPLFPFFSHALTRQSLEVKQFALFWHITLQLYILILFNYLFLFISYLAVVMRFVFSF